MIGPGSRVFGKYEVIRRVAVGGMGEIFLARQTGVVDRLVILKSLLPQLAQDDQALAQFLDEARILGSINHPNVCALYDVGEWEEMHFIAMEYINGVDLSHILRFCEENKKRLPPLTSATIVREAALGLDAAHVATDATGLPLRVVHRDISPHNIMVRQDGLAKVVDFGVAVAENRMQKTEAGLLKGKLGYMPPEQIKGSPVDPKADQFSLGVVLWELLTQRRLYVGENAAQVFMKILKEKVPVPSSLVHDIPKEIDAIVLRMTAQEPVERFPRLGDAALAIRRVLEQYKAADNAVAMLIKVTVGAELAARVKDLAPARTGAIPRVGTPSPQSTASIPGAFCGACGTQAQLGDRFCRTCGASVGTGTNPRAMLSGSGAAVTGSVPRVDVMSSCSGPALVDTQARESTAVVDAPATVAAAPAPVVGAPKSPTETAVVAGLVELLDDGLIKEANADVRAAAFAVMHKLASRAEGTIATRNDGRFSVTFTGAHAIEKAIDLATASVHAAARAGPGVMFRIAVAAVDVATSKGDDDKVALLKSGDVLVDNCAPGAAIVTDIALKKGGTPPTTRSASVKLADGSTVLAHELMLPHRLIGRSAEVQQLDAMLEAVASLSKTQQVMFLGEHGLGKTALLEVGAAFARDHGFVAGGARAARTAEPIALDVLRQLTRTVCQDLLAKEGRGGEWHKALELCGLPVSVMQRLRALIDDEDDAPLADVPAPRRRAVVKGSVLQLYDALVQRAPVALFVDDLHRADPQSTEILSELGARLPDKRLAIITASRPQQGERVLPLAKRVPLPPLHNKDIVTIAGLLLGSPVAGAMADLVVNRANGNPLMLSLTLRFMNSAGMIGHSPDGVQLTVSEEKANSVPNSATGLIHTHHATLPAEAQTLLTAAAHSGLVFVVFDVARLAEGVKDISGMLEALVENGIVAAIGPDSYRFTSTLELETIAGRLDANQARQLHTRSAEGLSRDLRARFTLELGERLATHLNAANLGQRAAEVSLQVADRAMSIGLFDLASVHYRKALAQDWRALSAAAADEEKAIRVLKDVAAATAALIESEPAAAIDVATPVLKGVPALMAVHARIEVLRQRALAFLRGKRFSEAENCLDEALETLQNQPDDAVAGGLLIDLASTLEQRGDVDSALAQLQEALQRLGHAPVGQRARAYDGLVLLGRLGLRQRQFEPARQAFTAAIEEARRAKRPIAEADARALVAGLWQAQGNLEGAVAETQAAIAIAESVADPLLEARLHQQHGRALVALGRRGDAAAALAKALDCAKRGQWDEGVSAAQQLLAVVGA